MSLNVEIITPEKLVYKDAVDFVAAPAYDGEIGILPGHTLLLTQLGMGELRLKKGMETFVLAVTGGFLEVHGKDEVSILAETAETADEINIEEERLKAERAKAVLETKEKYTDAELLQAEMAIKSAIMKMQIGKTRGRRGGPRAPQN